MYSGVAFRMAQVMRLNKEYHELHSFTEQEMRRRTFWACALLDRMLAYFLAKPVMLSSANISIDLPCTDASLLYLEGSKGITLHNLDLFQGHASGIGIMPFLIKTVFLWSDICQLHISNCRFTRKTPPTDPTSSFYQHHRAMSDWVTSLPPALRWSEENYRKHCRMGQSKEFISIHFLIRGSLCIARQSYLPQLDGALLLQDRVDAAGWSLLRREPTLISECVINALETVQILSTLLKQNGKEESQVQSIWLATSIMPVCNTLLWMQYANDPEYGNEEMARRARDSYTLFCTTIASWKTSWAAAEAWLDILEKMDAIYRAVYIDGGDQSIPEEHANPSEVRLEFRPQPGDGYTPLARVTNMFEMLRFLANDTSVKRTVLHFVWMGLSTGWTNDIFPTDTDFANLQFG